ncbi:MAG: hypothetical protein JXP34_14200 [Planctomycetes bacterium]|nr:hypothetical protein [Planctomycetota bacterium]
MREISISFAGVAVGLVLAVAIAAAQEVTAKSPGVSDGPRRENADGDLDNTFLTRPETDHQGTAGFTGPESIPDHEDGLRPPVTLYTRIRYLKGEAAYRISGQSKKISRLAFGIENILGEIEVAGALTQNIEIRGAFWTNVDRDAGTLEDRDYAEILPAPLDVECPDLVSRSDLALRMFGGRFDLGFRIPTGGLMDLFVGPEVTFEHMAFVADNTRYPTTSCWGIAAPTFIPERAIEYDRSAVTIGPAAWTNIPIVKNLSARFGACIGAIILWDRDDHVLRYIEARGWAYGPSGGIHGGVVWAPSPWLGFELLAGTAAYFAQGEQEHRTYAGPDIGYRSSAIDLQMWGWSYSISGGLEFQF